MGREALIKSLRSRAAEDVDALWRDVRARADGHRLELAQALEQQRSRDAQAAAALARRLEDAATLEARQRAREIRAQAALGLADRLYRLAVAELSAQHDSGGSDLFRALARELPARDWQRVRTNPADRELAHEQFPHAEVVCDANIRGGLEAEADGARIRVSNTLETRLATAWPDVLPDLIRDLLPDAHDQRTAP